MTLAGGHEEVLEAAFQVVREASERIDLREHEGAHPRMGACDVVPFTPLGTTTMEECAELARRLGKRVADELDIPVYLYGAAATRKDRKNLAKVRKGQFEKIREVIGTDETRAPDFGKAEVHPSAGCTGIGARFFLVAYNVNLKTTDVELAKTIGKTVREKDGGFKAVKGMGFDLPEKGMVQVSMNLVDYRETGMLKVFREIERLANEAGVEVAESEVIGLVPRGAVHQVFNEAVRPDADIAGQIVEDQLPAPAGDPLRSGDAFVCALASDSPTPGGGSAAALSGSIGAALSSMVGRLTVGRKKYAEVQAEMEKLIKEGDALAASLNEQITADAASYDGFMVALKMPKSNDEEKAARKQAMADAAMAATKAPLETARQCLRVLEQAVLAAKKGNRNAASDGAVSALMARAGLRGALLNVKINLPSVKDEAFVTAAEKECEDLEHEAERLEAEALEAAAL
jgi:glutamate formiminotransferase/formiminotetrahydrofolate cyclodeaminase